MAEYQLWMYDLAHEFDARRRMISKNFHHVLRVIDRQPLVGPPESMREHVVAASKAMKSGNWAACKEFLINDKMDNKVCRRLVRKGVVVGRFVKLILSIISNWYPHYVINMSNHNTE